MMNGRDHDYRHGLFRVRSLKPVLVATSLMLLSGCGITSDIFSISDVKPWERGTLAREDMQLVTDSIESSVDDHIYFSKEASTGGGGLQGGGCGCN